MLKEATITKVATLLKIDPAAFIAAVKATDEQDVAISDDLQVITKADAEVRDRNKYNEGKTAGSDMVIKDIKTKHKIEIEGTDPDKIVEAIGKNAVAAAQIAPDKQVEEIKKDRDQWKTKATTAEQATADMKKQTEQLTADNRIRGLFPKDRSEILNDDEYLMSAKSRFSIETRDGKEVVIDKTTGDIVKDKVKLEPVAPADVIKGYFTERKWLAEPDKGSGGRGGGNSAPPGGAGKFGKLSEARKWVEDQGKNIMAGEGKEMLQAAIKDNPDMDMGN